MTNPFQSNVDWLAGLAYLAGGSATSVGLLLADALPAHKAGIVAACGVVTVTAGLLLRLFKNPSPPAGQSSVTAPTPSPTPTAPNVPPTP